VIRAIHGAEADGRDPFFVAIEPCPVGIADAGLVDASSMGGAIALALVCSPVNRAVGPGEARIASACAIVCHVERIENKGAGAMQRTIVETIHVYWIRYEGHGTVDSEPASITQTCAIKA